MEKSPFYAVVDCGGVGYRLSITLATYESLPPAGNEVRLLAHLLHREDGMELFGFCDARERELFEKLISVTRVGPRLALAILSGAPFERIISAIATGDVETLAAIPKVGKKTAERIVMELRDKFELPTPVPQEDELFAQAVDALVVLGFSRSEATKAVARAVSENPNMQLDEIIKVALRG